MENETGPEKVITIGGNDGKWLTPQVIMAGVLALVLILLACVYIFKGAFIAATVNGSPISRLSVMLEAEKQAGADILEARITRKLIENALDDQGIQVTEEEVAAEMEKISGQIEATGATLDQMLEAQGMTRAELEDQIRLQKRVEKVVADKITVTDAEVDQYIKDNEITLPAGTTMEALKADVMEGLKQQKFSDAAGAWVESLRTAAKINTYASY